MSKNIKSQFLYVINTNFREGMDKHSLKRQGYARQTKIFSFSDRKNLIDTSASFSNWLKQKYPNIKYIKDIKNTHVQQYLSENAKSWTKATIQTKMSHFKKLEKLANQTFSKSNVRFTNDLIRPTGKDNSRTLTMQRTEYNKLIKTIENSKSHGKTALELAGRFGLRASETTKLQYRDIKIAKDKATIHVHDSKGGRSRDIVTTKKEDIEYLKKLKGDSDTNERIVPIRTSSVNKFANRAFMKAGLGQYVEAKTSLHSIRKMVAQEKFDEYRSQGHTREESINLVSNFLGHGDNRDELISRYVSNIY